MTKVITYGTYDLLHHGHIRLLERAKALGDYLVVGITADGFDQARGKINVKQSLIERIEGVKATGLADEIIVEEYEGQKIDDIRRLGIDIFTVGSDWKGHFDYLNEYCKVIYLDRTQGISSSEIRSESSCLRIGIVGESPIINKFIKECQLVNGVQISGIFSLDNSFFSEESIALTKNVTSIDELIKKSDALYIISHPSQHYSQIKNAINNQKHVLCESPLSLSNEHWDELKKLSKKNNVIIADGIKTAYSTAYNRLLLLTKSGVIGKVMSVDATCTSLSDLERIHQDDLSLAWSSICAWGPTALLPVFQILGTDYSTKTIISLRYHDYDLFTKMSFVYPDSVASIKVGTGVKSEGELIISGTKGYIYVPAPWWKTDYFEIRYENPADNKRIFYQLDGEGIRYEIVSFKRMIEGYKNNYIDSKISDAIVNVMNDYYVNKKITILKND